MNNLYTIIYTVFVKSFTYKKGALAVLSLPLSISIQTIIKDESFFGISLGLLMVLTLLIILDFISGIIASKVNKERLKSHLIAKTFYKCIMIFFFFWFLFEINNQLIKNIDSTNPKAVSDWVYNTARPVVSFVRTFMFILITFREWISVGENYERITGHQLYIFTLGNKVFNWWEKVFKDKIDNDDSCGADKLREYKNKNTEQEPDRL